LQANRPAAPLSRLEFKAEAEGGVAAPATAAAGAPEAEAA